jgi:hypothetical protein
MYISYFDESGDDGYPKYSSETFILTSIYMHHSKWRENYDRIYNLRKYLKKQYGFPIKQELHTRDFIMDKEEYHGRYTPEQRREIIFWCCKLLYRLQLKIINVCIDKKKINRPTYNVLKNALTYNIQRIENDMRYISGESRFIMITDEGRLSTMTKTTREIQKINYIPSHYTAENYRREIKCMIEDPLPKNSAQSYFIQLADMVSYLVNLYIKQNISEPKVGWSKRVKNVFADGDIIELMSLIKPCLNLKASKHNEFGIVCYPK